MWCRWPIYYGVSCDYLLGRSAERSGQTITVEDPAEDSATAGSAWRGSVLPTMYKKLIANSLEILYDKLAHCRDKRVVTAVSDYLMLAVYAMFRQLYQAAPKNVASLFRISPARWPHAAEAAMAAEKGRLAAVLAGEDEGGPAPDPAVFAMTTETLAQEYPAPRHQPDEPCQKQRGNRAAAGAVKAVRRAPQGSLRGVLLPGLTARPARGGRRRRCACRGTPRRPRPLRRRNRSSRPGGTCAA